MAQGLPADAVRPAALGLPGRPATRSSRTPVVLELDPGLAFGTGTHATTALCLEWLDGGHPGRRARARLRLRFGDSRPCRTQARRCLRNRLRHRSAGPAGDARECGRKTDSRIASTIPARASEVAGRVRRRARQHPFRPARRTRAGPRSACRPGRRRGARRPAVAPGRRGSAGLPPWFDIGPVAERDGWTLLAGRRRVE